MKNKKIIAIVVALLIPLLAFGIYVGDYYHADPEAEHAFSFSEVETAVLPDGNVAVSSGMSDTGLIFYPGGKVEHTAYLPLMKACAEKGITCVITEMPFNLAVFDISAAEGIAQQYPEIEHWYIGGHSLGGSMAASYAAENSEAFEGVILLGSYSAADISESGLGVLSVFGSEDKVLNREKYEECKANLPDDFSEYIIDGGCHAYFGAYGFQSGDGTPFITNEEQIYKTAELIAEFTTKSSAQSVSK